MCFGKGLTMKTVSLLSVLMVAVCLVGCENPDLVTCQQEKEALQGQLEQANAAIAEKEARIEKMKADNIAMQNKAMESITTMMQKQATKDKEMKQALSQKKKEAARLRERVHELEKQVTEHKCPVPEAPAMTAVEAPAEAAE